MMRFVPDDSNDCNQQKMDAINSLVNNKILAKLNSPKVRFYKQLKFVREIAIDKDFFL